MRKKAFTLEELAHITKAEVVGDRVHVISNVESLDEAGSSDASFLGNAKCEGAMRLSKAGVVFVARDVALEPGRNFLVVENPSVAFQKTIEALGLMDVEERAFKGVHPTAFIHAEAQIGNDVTVAANAVIDKGAKVGARTYVGPGVYIGVGTEVGEDCILHPNAVIREHCVLGNRVILQPCAVIGSCGYGFSTDKNGIHTKIRHVGNVVLEDDVEVGGNTVIERARFKTTKIGKGSKISNLVVIGHNVIVGKHNLVVGQAGIAGSSETEDHVVIAAQTGVAGHLKIAKGAMVAARSGVSKSITEVGGKYGGVPALPFNEYQRTNVHIRRLESYAKRIEALEKRLAVLEE